MQLHVSQRLSPPSGNPVYVPAFAGPPARRAPEPQPNLALLDEIRRGLGIDTDFAGIYGIDLEDRNAGLREAHRQRQILARQIHDHIRTKHPDLWKEPARFRKLLRKAVAVERQTNVFMGGINAMLMFGIPSLIIGLASVTTGLIVGAATMGVAGPAAAFAVGAGTFALLCPFIGLAASTLGKRAVAFKKGPAKLPTPGQSASRRPLEIGAYTFLVPRKDRGRLPHTLSCAIGFPLGNMIGTLPRALVWSLGFTAAAGTVALAGAAVAVNMGTALAGPAISFLGGSLVKLTDEVMWRHNPGRALGVAREGIKDGIWCHPRHRVPSTRT